MQQTALRTAGVVFLLVATAHYFRFILGVDVVVSGHLVPSWTSVGAGIGASALAAWMFRAGQ